MNWEIASQIATASSAFIAVITLISAYRLYSQGKIDAKISSFRLFLGKMEFQADKLDRLANHEVLHDMTRSMVFAKETELMFIEFCKELKVSDVDITKKEELLKFVKKSIPNITIPVMSKIAIDYENAIYDIKAESMALKSDYPGLYLIVYSVFSVFQIILLNSRRLLSQDEVWEEVIAAEIENTGKDVDPTLLQYRTHVMLTALSLHKFREAHDQEDIDSMKSLVQLTSRAYQRLSDSSLRQQSKREKAQNLKDADDMKKATEFFFEAEKVCRGVFGEAELLEYHRIASAFEERNKPTKAA